MAAPASLPSAATAAAGEAAAPFAPAVPVAADVSEGGGVRTPHRGEAGADDRPPESPSV